MTGIICDYFNEIQDKYFYTHEDIIKLSNGEGLFIEMWYTQAKFYFDMKEKGYRVEVEFKQ